MTAYVIRRLLLMIPTFIGILIINFAVLRLQGPTLVDQMQAGVGKGGGEGGPGERKAQGAAKDVENYIDRFRRSGLDLPALVNVRGFTGRDEVVARLRDSAGDGPNRERPSVRNGIEKNLWLGGPQLVEPLLAVVADDSLATLHAPAVLALTYCAYVTVTARDLARMPAERLNQIQERNERLRNDRIRYTNTAKGFATVDSEAAAKRADLLALFAIPGTQAEFTAARATRWSDALLRTGFCDFMAKLFTAQLYSESRKDYVFSVIADRWYVTFWLNTISIVIAWAGSILLGIRSARRSGSLEDRVTTSGLFLAWSMPSMFFGTLLLYYFCTDTSGSKAWFPNRGLSSDGSMWLPTGEYLLDLLWHAFLPLVVLSYNSFTALSRYMRANLLEQLDADYVRSARAKGCDDDAVVYRHAVGNSLITMITLGGGLLADLFSGALIVELIFSIPGLGWLMLDAAIQSDGPLLMGSTVITVSLLLMGILISDLLYAVVDPRIRGRYA